LTKDVGFQIGVRRTLPIGHEDAWRLLTSDQGLKIWLGPISGLDFAKGARYQLADGSAGEVRVYSPNSHLRITWRPRGWPRASTIQVRAIPKGDKTVIAFHQEHLPGAKEREERRAHFRSALDELERVWGRSCTGLEEPVLDGYSGKNLSSTVCPCPDGYFAAARPMRRLPVYSPNLHHKPGGLVMRRSLLMGIGHHMLPVPGLIWRRHVRGGAQLDLLSEEHHRVRNFVVRELPRVGEPLSPEFIAQGLGLPPDQVLGILDDLEKHMTFLFRNEGGAVEWAYPVTVDQTPHRMTFSTSERVNAA
jgi:uncharacterized protein YndB with AHSA1/START domain